jgi:hypothetical protein
MYILGVAHQMLKILKSQLQGVVKSQLCWLKCLTRKIGEKVEKYEAI